MKITLAQRFYPPLWSGGAGLRADCMTQALARMGSVSDVVTHSFLHTTWFCPANSHPRGPAARDSEFLVTEAEQADPRSAFHTLPSVDASCVQIPPPRELARSWGLHSGSPKFHGGKRGLDGSGGPHAID
eukprot:455048-Pyramimonas_sp.AAC.2